MTFCIDAEELQPNDEIVCRDGALLRVAHIMQDDDSVIVTFHQDWIVPVQPRRIRSNAVVKIMLKEET